MEKRPDLADTGKPVERYKFPATIEDDALRAIKGVFPVSLWDTEQADEIAARIGVEKMNQFSFRASDATLEKMYAQGFNLYKSGRYKEALPRFKLLIMTHPKEPRYTFAVAACLHLLKQYSEAGYMYNISSILDPSNPLPQYHLANCCILTNNPVGAYLALQMALKRCKQSVHHKALQERIEMELATMTKDFEEKKREGFKYFQTDPDFERRLKKYDERMAKYDIDHSLKL